MLITAVSNEASSGEPSHGNPDNEDTVPYKFSELRYFSNEVYDDQDLGRDGDEDCDVYFECNDGSELFRPVQTADEIFMSEKQIEAAIRSLSHGDLYVLGALYIRALKALLVGASLQLMPVVNAAKPENPPERPPKMKYKDLPIYKSPHYEYKEYIADREKCPEYKTKILCNYLLPHVKKFRKEAQCKYCKWKCVTKKTLKDVYCSYDCTKKDIKAFMRDPNNLQTRQGLVVGGILSGLLMGSTLTRKIIYSSIGGLATGALCFPNETDNIFRNAAYDAGKTFISLYNLYCNKNFVMRERVPCSDSIPEEPLKNKKKEQCPQPKEKTGGWF